jgi:signal peptidase II
VSSDSVAAPSSPTVAKVNALGSPSAWSFGRLAAMAGMIALPILILDQLSKIYVSTHFRMFEIYLLIPGWLDCTYTLNPGAAFSLFANMPAVFREAFFIGLSAAAVVVMTVLIARRSTTASMALACALVLAGTIGNLIDRVVRGRVIDFIYFHHDAFRYPVFNRADAAITTGVAMILLFSWLHERAANRQPAAVAGQV